MVVELPRNELILAELGDETYTQKLKLADRLNKLRKQRRELRNIISNPFARALFGIEEGNDISLEVDDDEISKLILKMDTIYSTEIERVKLALNLINKIIISHENGI